MGRDPNGARDGMETKQMKLSVDTKLFLAALRVVGIAANSRTTLPILGNVKLEAKDGTLTLSGTDLDLYISDSIGANIEKAGALTAPHGLLLKLVGNIQASRISLSGSAKTLEVTGGDVMAKLDTLAADEFPAPFAQDEARQIECDSDDILEPFRMLVHAIGKDSQRYTLMGVNIAPGKTGTDFAATNGTRLAMFHADAKLTEADVIAPEHFVKAVLGVHPNGAAILTISNAVITLAVNETRISSKLIEGTYPNYTQVIPANGSNIFSCNRKDLQGAITTCDLFTEREMHWLVMTGKGKHVEISRPPKATSLLLGAELDGQPDFSIQFNSRHMLDTLSVMSGEDVRIRCSDAKTPMLIEEGTFRAVLVPVSVTK
jgi:DNA polymerase-3 subunit beta